MGWPWKGGDSQLLQGQGSRTHVGWSQGDVRESNCKPGQEEYRAQAKR